MDEKSNGIDLIDQSDIAGPSTMLVDVSPPSPVNENKNAPIVSVDATSVFLSSSVTNGSPTVSDSQVIPSTDLHESKCKNYYHPTDGTIYIVDSIDHSNDERRLPFLSDLQSLPVDFHSSPKTLCYVKISPFDDDATPLNAFSTYAVVEADEFRDGQSSSSPSEEEDNYANRNILMCLLCNMSVFSSSAAFMEHSETAHDVLLSIAERAIFENKLSPPGAILYKIQNDTDSIISFLLPTSVDDKIETDKISNQDLNMSPLEVATTLMLASNLSASRLMQMQNDDRHQHYTVGTVNRCNLHPDGKSVGVECPKCDLMLGSSRSLGGHITMMHSRNSCKTLKCPKCNWHYKYQETLEIHMNEKHSDAPTSCVYCVSNSPHPRLGRGEQWSCGYKPYRCDVCKYSTTTKGNLAIHMQSDKHLNNVQEMQKTNLCSGGSSSTESSSTSNAATAAAAAALIQSVVGAPLIVGPPTSQSLTTINANSIIGGESSSASTSNKTKPSWRCDVCNYETNVARNLRIHMTSEKHTQNLLILHQSVKTLQQQSPQSSTSTFHHRPMVDMSSPMSCIANAATSSSNVVPTSSSTSLLNFTPPTCAEDVLSSSLALNLQNLMFESTLNDGKLFQCCICLSFACDTLAELINHSQNIDRTRPNETDVSILAGNYVCNLCHYKTHLKANFQLHTKTDKHLQRLQLVNHVREGGPQNELRLKYLNPNNPAQLRCVACNEFVNSFHKLQMHLSTNRHRSFASSYEKILTSNISATNNNCLYCILCEYVASEKRSMLTHLHSESHNELLNQILPVIESSGGVETNPLNWIEIRDKSDENLSVFDEDEEDIENDDENCLGVHRRRQTMTDDGVHCCGECNFCFENETALESHVQEEHQIVHHQTANNSDSIYSMCPLCQKNCGSSRERLECHLSQMHKVPKEGVQRLLNWLPTTTTSPPPETSLHDDDDQKTLSSPPALCCTLCNTNFDDVDSLFDHQQQNVGHVETKEFQSSSSVDESPTVHYLCWSIGCKENFDSLSSVQNHFRQIHTLSSSVNGGIIKKCDADSTTNLKCPICSRLCRSNISLQSHIERSHVNNNSSSSCQQSEKGFKLFQTKQNIKNISSNSSPTLNDNGVDEQRLSSELNNDGSSSGGDLLDWSTTFNDEHLNSPTLAEACYRDPNRTFKCDRCEMAFTKQIFLAVHNRTLQHRQNAKSVSSRKSSSSATSCVMSSEETVVGKKYKDPCRPYKCDVCKESFTQKNILIVHYNSVSHLNKLKKLSPPSSSVDGHSSSSVAKRRNSSASIVDGVTENYKCNICKVAYGSGCTLDVHLRSVAHQHRVNRFHELIVSGEIDLNVPLIEQPDGSRPPSVDKKNKSLINYDKQSIQNLFQQRSSSSTSPIGNVLNPLLNISDDIWQNLLAAASSSSMKNDDSLSNGKSLSPLPSSSSPNNQPLTNLEQIVRSGFHKNYGGGKTGLAFRKMLENYGFEVVMQYNEAHHRKRSKLLSIVDDLTSMATTNENDEPELKKLKKSNERIVVGGSKQVAVVQQTSPKCEVPELTKCKCVYCDMDFSSVWVLKSHVEQVHKRLIPMDEVEKISNEFKQVYDKKVANGSEDAIVADRKNSSYQSSSLTENKTPHLPNPPLTSPPTSSQNISSHQSAASAQQMNSQMATMAAMSMGMGLGVQYPFMGVPFGPFNPFLPMMMPNGFDQLSFSIPSSSSASSNNLHVNNNSKPNFSMSNMNSALSASASAASTPMLIQQQQKRARTRITDEQLKVLREYFDIYNSPSEEQIEQMSMKSGLPQKVIKHWFRNTLFKERQRSKDSPYNFNIPPSCGIDLEEYEKTGETKIIPYNHNAENEKSNVVDEKQASTEENVKESPMDIEKNLVKREIIEETCEDEKSMKEDTSIHNDSKLKIEEESEFVDEEYDDYDDFDNIRDFTTTNNQTVFNSLNAHETLRQLAAVGLSSMQMQFLANGNNGGCVGGVNNEHMISPLSSLLSQHASMQNQSTNQNSSSDLTNMIANALSPNNQSMNAAGRRANRTRFTEPQVKTLQDFFEKNAYPKDDDLEILSNKLNLSPRVIVVWFQNARQKARKIYENQPSSSDMIVGDDRFVRTPGLNYQCKKCNLVFQRYYELIKHQKSTCFKDESKFDGDQSPPPNVAIQTTTTNSNRSKSASNSSNSPTKSISNQKLSTSQPKTTTTTMGNLSSGGVDEHASQSAALFAHLFLNDSNSKIPDTDSFYAQLQSSLEDFEENANKQNNMQISSDQLAMLNLKYTIESNPSPKVVDQISSDLGLSKTFVLNWFQNARTEEKLLRSSSVGGGGGTNGNSNLALPIQFFNKRCPFCGILFHSKSTMESHLHSKHPSQYASLGVDVLSLPDAEEVPTITTVPLTEAIWNAAAKAAGGNTTTATQSLLSLGMVPGTTTVSTLSSSTSVSVSGKKSGELDSIIERLAPSVVANKSSSVDETPLDLSRSLKPGSSDELNFSSSSTNFVNNRTPSNNSNEDDTSFMSYEENDDSRSFYSNQGSPSNSPQHQILAALARPQKRFRTRLTPQQIRVMKHFFCDFKTPSMSECEILGNEMSLHKRVVQVWFQNARAKERKVKLASGSLTLNDGVDMKTPPAKCLVCDIPYTGRMNMQDHSFSKSHIEKVRKNVEETADENPSNAGSYTPDYIEKSSSDVTKSSKQRTSSVVATVDSINEAGTSNSRSSTKTSTVALRPQTVTGQNSNPTKKSSSVAAVESSLNAASLAQNILPYMYAAGNPAAYYASMMMPSGFGGATGLSNGNLFYDPTIHGTPLNLLQIPANVMQTIGVSLQRGKEFFCRFTQDGKNVSDLVKILKVQDRSCVGEKDIEVGWTCRSCMSVFQAEALYLNHQNLICQSKERAFKLIQTHYECKWCNLPCGTQTEFVAHCETPDHRSKSTKL